MHDPTVFYWSDRLVLAAHSETTRHNAEAAHVVNG